MSNSFFVLAVCGGKIFSNFLKFSLFFSFFLERGGGGARSGGGCRRHFLYLIFFLEKIFLKFSLFFSFFLEFSRNTFLCIGIPGKFSQIFSFFLFFSRIFSKGGGRQMGGGCHRHFLYLTFWGKNCLNFFQSFSECIFCIGGMLGKYYPKFFQSCARTFFFSCFFQHIKSKFSLRLEA